MARKSKKTEALVANTIAAIETPTPEINSADIEAIMSEFEADAMAEDAEIAAILAAEEVNEPTAPVVDIAQATAEANGSVAALAQAAAEAVEDTPAPAVVVDDRAYADILNDVTEVQVTQMQSDLTAAFADRASYERASNPNNDNIQKTLTKVQRGHLAHGISKALHAVGLPANYLNKSEVSGKRRNVYALEKLQDLIYGANTGRVKNAINAAVLVSMVKLEQAGMAFTGAVAKACASDKIAVDAQLKGLLRRHTVAESTASTQSSSTMTALEDLGAVVNNGTQKHPQWTFSNTPIARRLREIGVAMMGAAA